MNTSVVVNAAEGEPGSFKDRAILRANPYRVLEGALIAAVAVAADSVHIAMKGSFRTEIDRVGRAIAEVRAAGWADGVGWVGWVAVPCAGGVGCHCSSGFHSCAAWSHCQPSWMIGSCSHAAWSCAACWFHSCWNWSGAP